METPTKKNQTSKNANPNLSPNPKPQSWPQRKTPNQLRLEGREGAAGGAQLHHLHQVPLRRAQRPPTRGQAPPKPMNQVSPHPAKMSQAYIYIYVHIYIYILSCTYIIHIYIWRDGICVYYVNQWLLQTPHIRIRRMLATRTKDHCCKLAKEYCCVPVFPSSWSEQENPPETLPHRAQARPRRATTEPSALSAAKELPEAQTWRTSTSCASPVESGGGKANLGRLSCGF